uniref:SHSP domain-containing protein n=1 Tax=Chrysemys picta bellii TaxID=8478 RepID=A0A8C3I1U8_CHRPI
MGTALPSAAGRARCGASMQSCPSWDREQSTASTFTSSGRRVSLRISLYSWEQTPASDAVFFSCVPVTVSFLPSTLTISSAGEKPLTSMESWNLSFPCAWEPGSFPAELMVRVDGRKLTVTGKQEKKTASEAGACSHEYREIRRETLLPEDVNVEAVLCSLSQDGQLCIEVPHLALPAAEGRAIPVTVCQGVKAGEGNLATEGKEPGSSEKMETGGESEGTSPRDS